MSPCPRPPDDPALPHLDAALDPTALADAIARGWAPARTGAAAVVDVAPAWVRYKPGTSLIVRAVLRYRGAAGGDGDGDGGGVHSTWATVTLYGDGRDAVVSRPGGRLDRLDERAAELHGAPAARTAHLADLRAVLQLSPVDRKLPGLVEATAPGAMARLLGGAVGGAVGGGAVEVVRHVPERKAVLRIDGGPDGGAAYAKLHARRDAARLGKLQRDLAARGLPVGRLLAVDAARGMTVVAAVPGRTLREQRDAGGAALAAGTAAAMAAFARLHALPATCRVATDLARRSAGDEAAAVRGAAAYLDGLAPATRGRAGRLAARIAAAIEAGPWRSRIVHGDAYDKQVLVGADGVRLIDFDDAAIGEPALDYGTFVAHHAAWAAAAAAGADGADRAQAARAAATADAVRAVVAAHVAAVDPTAGRQLALFEAAALLRLAVHPFRRLDPRWPAALEATVAAAEARLAEHGRTTHGAGAAPPLDPALPTLPLAVDPGHIAAGLRQLGHGGATVTAARVVRHKPGRRCLVRYDVAVGDGEVAGVGSPVGPPVATTPLYGKVFASARGPRVHDNLTRLDAALALQGVGGPRLPAPVGYLDEARVVLLGPVPGVPVTARLCAGDGALAERIGAALAALHAAPAALARRHGPADELAPLEARVARLAAADGRLGRRAAAALDRLAALAPAAAAWRCQPVHRDLHPEQVLVGDDGGIGFVDLDDAALSEPALDVGNFVAHLIWLGCRAPSGAARLRAAAAAFTRAHGSRDRRRDPAVLRWCEAVALLRLADVHLAAGGVPLAAALVTACTARLGLSGEAAMAEQDRGVGRRRGHEPAWCP